MAQTNPTALPPLLAAARALELDRDAASSGDSADYRRGLTRAAQLLRILNEDEPPAVAPPADRVGLRQRITAAIHADLTSTAYRRDGGLLGIVPRLADAVLAVLPAPDQQAAVAPPPALTEEGRLRSRVTVLEDALKQSEGLAKVGARCMRTGHQGLIEHGRVTIEGHRFALSVKLDLGTGASWDAIYERAAELRRLADETQPAKATAVDLSTLAAALDGLHTLIATSSRDWQTYRVDAWIWAVICGWDCEQAEHDDTCTHGALEETAGMHGWDEATVAKARRYRAAVRAVVEAHQDGAQS